MPNLNAIRQSVNLLYCINNPIRYIDLNESEAGDPFKSRDDAAIDFAETIGGKSIEENLEYASYIYSWEEEKHFLFIKYNKTYYSYTEPFAGEKDHVDVLNKYNVDLSEEKTWKATIHTHGAHSVSKATGENDDFFFNGRYNICRCKWNSCLFSITKWSITII